MITDYIIPVTTAERRIGAYRQLLAQSRSGYKYCLIRLSDSIIVRYYKSREDAFEVWTGMLTKKRYIIKPLTHIKYKIQHHDHKT